MPLALLPQSPASGGTAPAGALPAASAAGPASLLRPLLSQVSERPERERLQAVNDFVNRHLGFRDDRQVWGLDDYWASPLEALARGAGDCEDYAIAKYFILLAAGVPLQRLRLVYVQARLPWGRLQPHMVLAYQADPGAAPLLLDNLTGAIEPVHRRPDLQPVFSFNGEGLWQGVGTVTAGDPLRRLSPWRDLLARARAEGFVP